MMLPRARHIVVRDDESFAIAQQYTTHATLATDFSLPILHYFTNQKLASTNSKNTPDQYILLNTTPHLPQKSWLPELEDFCQHRKNVQKFFVPCDIQNDLPLYQTIRKHVPSVKLYDRTNHTLDETLQLFRDTQAGCGARLHFLYPLKVFHKPREVIVYKDKVRKLILSS
jgi:polysaccharide pyruvyl transferase WcaK-like protein